MAKKEVTETFTLTGQDLTTVAEALANNEIYEKNGEYYVSEGIANYE
jgi:hypothetical protein